MKSMLFKTVKWKMSVKNIRDCHMIIQKRRLIVACNLLVLVSISQAEANKDAALTTSPRFGAYYVQGRVRDLRDPVLIDNPFEAYSHIQVLFDEQPVKFDFPRGSHAPYMVTENGIKYTNEWIETIDPENCESFCEPVMDRQGRYSRTRIIENTDARVVIHWRFALSDHKYRLAHMDESGWSDWGDEIYTVYPDGVHVRLASVYSPVAPKSQPWWPNEDEQVRHEFQESIVLCPPGGPPTDYIEVDAVTVINMEGKSRTFSYEPYPATRSGYNARNPDAFGRFSTANMQVINLKSQYKPFTIIPADGAEVGPYEPHIINGKPPEFTFVTWGNRDFTKSYSCGITRIFSHEYFRRTDKSLTQIFLSGLLKDPDPTSMTLLARSWLSAPKLALHGHGYTSEGYDVTQRAYVLNYTSAGVPSALEFELGASEESPVVNPCFLVKGWGDADVTLKIDAQPIGRGKDFRFGHVRGRLGGPDLVVWIDLDSTKTVKMSLSPEVRN